MSNSKPTPETVIDRVIERKLAGGIHTVSIGYIEAWDPVTGEAEVQLARLAPFRNEAGVRVPYKRDPLPHVPVIFPGGGGARDTWPIKPGDACVVFHCSGPIARWLVQGGIVDENADASHHRLESAVALVGISDFAHFKPAHATARVLEAEQVLLGGQDASDPVVRRSDLDAVVADLRADLLTLVGHVHPAPGGATSVSTQLTGLGGVTTPACSTVVRAK